MKNKEIFAPIIVGLVSSTLVLGLRATGLLQHWEWAAYDRFFQAKPSEPIDKRIVLVGISEQDVQQAETYPFSDGLWAEFLRKLSAHEPRVIGLDIFRDQTVPPGSQELKEVFKTLPNLVGIAKLPPEPVEPPPILKQKQQYGDVSGSPDLDGVNRRAFLFPNSDIDNPDSEIPSFALKLSFLYLQKEGIVSQNSSLNANWLQLGKAHFRHFESNDGGYVGANAGGYRILINWRNPQQFREVQFFDVINGKIPSDFFEDRIVIVGASGLSFNDFHETPFTSVSQKLARGIDIHSQVTSSIIAAAFGERSLIKVIPEYLEWLITIFLSVISSFVLWKEQRLHSRLIVTSLFLASILSVAFVFFCYLAFLISWWIPVIPGLIALWISCTHTAYLIYGHQLKNINNNLEKIVQERTKDLELAYKQILKEEKLNITQKLFETLEKEIASPAHNLEIVLHSIQKQNDLVKYLVLEPDYQELSKNITEQIKQCQKYWSRLNFIFGRQPLLQERIPYELIADANLHDLLKKAVNFNINILNKNFPWIQDNLSIYYSCRFEWEVSTDFNFRRHLIYILSHLIENSVEAINEKNNPEYSERWLKVWISEEHSSLEIKIQDNGIGMTIEEINKACEPFFSRKNKLGLGLYLSKQIVGKYGGYLKIDSEFGKGTEIQVYFCNLLKK